MIPREGVESEVIDGTLYVVWRGVVIPREGVESGVGLEANHAAVR